MSYWHILSKKEKVVEGIYFGVIAILLLICISIGIYEYITK